MSGARAVDLLSGRPRYRAVCFDVDSTLAAIEGVDWLADRRGPAIAAESHALTTQAMDGRLPIEAVYQRRLARIRPTVAEVALLADAYVGALQPGMDRLLATLMARACAVHLVSGGFRQAILPLARRLGVPDAQVHAVTLAADPADGTLSLLDGAQPLATQAGKPALVRALALPAPAAMVGDGSTDAAVRDHVHTFIAYTGVVHRPAVVAAAHVVAASVAALVPLLLDERVDDPPLTPP
ncbi:MAG: HAD-IB family phosphatase [Gemmatimonadetes bacterium]|nr:HAD-IB family phosphatase [Gemmatimonadota bacterium]